MIFSHIMICYNAVFNAYNISSSVLTVDLNLITVNLLCQVPGDAIERDKSRIHPHCHMTIIWIRISKLYD